MSETDDKKRKENVALGALTLQSLSLAPTLVVVILANSVALFAGFLKCFNETVATLISWLILRRVNRGEGHDYDYGLGKVESLASFVVTGLLFLSFMIVCFGGIRRILQPAEVNAGGALLGMVIQVCAVVMDTWFWRKNYELSKKEYSPIMEAQWRLFRAKTVAEATVLVSLILSVSLMKFRWSVYIDPACSFVVAGFLLWSVRDMVRRSIGDLLDKTLDESMQMLIVRKLAQFFAEYRDFHGVRSRRSGARIYIEVFLEFDDDRTMAEAQDTIDRMTEAIEGEIEGSFVVIAPTRRELTDRLKAAGDYSGAPAAPGPDG